MYVQQIIDNFARSANRYDTHAEVQFQCAGRLADYIEANSRDLVEGNILEIGCGTGILTRRLFDLFPVRKIVASDICPEMLARCRMRLTNTTGELPGSLDLQLIDAVTPPAEMMNAAIIGAFTLQWIDPLERALDALANTLVTGGKLFFSLPVSGSFPEWRNVCNRAGVTCTANTLPSPVQFRNYAKSSGLRLSVYEETFPVQHDSFQQFLFSLKSIGAGTTIGHARLSISEMRKLIKCSQEQHPGKFTATYKVMFGHLSKA